MGCFLGCLGSSKDGKRQKKRNKKNHKTQRYGMQNVAERTNLLEYGTPERATEPVNVVPEKCVPAEQFSASPTKKRVTFNTNVKTYEPVPVCDSTDYLLEGDTVRKGFKDYVVKLRDDDSGSENDSITSSVGSYPQNHRYQNCRESDDEAEEYSDSDLDDDDEEEEEDGLDLGGNDDYDVGRYGGSQEKEVWPESVVTESAGLRTKNPLVRMNSEEVNSPFKALNLTDEGNRAKAGYARDRSTYIHPVLNPVENLTQWKALKSKGSSLSLKPQKENSTTDIEAPRISLSSETKFKNISSSPKSNKLKTTNQDVAVDASLSNWLVSPEITPVKNTNRSSGLETITSERSGSQCSNSVVSFEDRPILGALTVDELRHMSATNSPRKSPTHSPDDMPIIGTVGTYWRTQA